ncbi:MAG: hypothetical protein JHC31_13250 [Sulfurihydrogenibium sp.]|jgi:hypothetical protein|nr:hypothetical protein [Sulfurihydrogenibium sp.]
MKTETLNIIKEDILAEETLEEQLTYLFVARDETLAMIDAFGDEEELVKRFEEINEEIRYLKELIKSRQN